MDQFPVLPPVPKLKSLSKTPVFMERFWHVTTWLIWSFSGLLLLILLFSYAHWFAKNVYPWIERVYEWILIIDLLVFFPLLIFRRSRRAAAQGLYLSSWVLGINCWLVSFLLTYITLGTFWAVFGTLLAGAGVFPLAFVGSVMRYSWLVAADIPFLLLLTFSVRLVGLRFLAPRPH